ncbi:MAG: ABC transporter ATP-binding protein [Anaerolineae bacterium]
MPPVTIHPVAIQAFALTRRFGTMTAVDRLDLAVPAGCIFGFLGPNGAGKTTTLKMLTGLMMPSEGRAVVAGLDVANERLALKARIGVVPEQLGLYERLSLREHLELVGRLHGLPAATIERRSAALLERMDLADKAGSLVVDGSTGMRKKLSLACALLPDPQVLFLDEPFEGVDPVSTRAIKDLLRALVDERGVTVFFSTHMMELVERLCDRAAIIQNGRLVAEGGLADLRAAAGLEATATLENVFLALVGADKPSSAALSWLDE